MQQGQEPSLPISLIRQVFGEQVLVPRDIPGHNVPVLARYVAAITPGLAPLKGELGLPTLGEELAHLLSTIESYLDDVAPGYVTKRKWLELILAGKSYEEFEQLRREAENAGRNLQPARMLNEPWLARPVSVVQVLWHLADHTAHHRGRLAVNMRMCGVDPPKL